MELLKDNKINLLKKSLGGFLMRIKKEVFEKELKYDGQIILKYTIEYPQIIEEKWI